MEIYNQCSEDILDDFLPLSFLADHRCSWCNFGVNNTHISRFDYRVFELIVLHVDWLSLVLWVISQSLAPPPPFPPTILQLLFSGTSLLRSFLIISFLVVISDLRNAISFSRLVIHFLSTTVWYSSWLCKLIFCCSSFCIKSLISFFVSGNRISLIFFILYIFVCIIDYV